jgi:hypothetical protein
MEVYNDAVIGYALSLPGINHCSKVLEVIKSQLATEDSSREAGRGLVRIDQAEDIPDEVSKPCSSLLNWA